MGGKKSISLSVHTRKVSLGPSFVLCTCGCLVIVLMSNWKSIAAVAFITLWGIAVEMVAKRLAFWMVLKHQAAATLSWFSSSAACRHVNLFVLLWKLCRKIPIQNPTHPTSTHPPPQLNHGWIDACRRSFSVRAVAYIQHNLWFPYQREREREKRWIQNPKVDK